MKNLAIFLMAAMAFAATAGGHQHQQGNVWQKPAPSEKTKKMAPAKPRQSPGTTLDKEKPTPPPGDGFLIHGREGKAMDAGRPAGTQPDWDLWRK